MWSATFELNDVLAVSLPILVILLSVIAGLVTYIIRRLVRSNDALVAKVQELETTLAHMDGKANGEAKRVTALLDVVDIRFTALGEASVHTREDLSSVNNRFDGLHQEVGGLREGLGNLYERVDGLQQEVGGLREGLSNMQREIGAIQGDLRRAEAGFGEMQRQVDRARSNLRQIREGEVPDLD